MINTNNFISKFIIRRRWETGFNCNQGIHSKRNKNSRRDPRAKVHVVKNTLINPTPFVCCMLWNVIGDWYCEHSTNRSAGFSNKRLFYLNFDAMLHFSLLRFNFISWHFATFLAINVGIIWASRQHLEKKQQDKRIMVLSKAIKRHSQSHFLSFDPLSYLRVVFNTIK